MSESSKNLVPKTEQSAPPAPFPLSRPLESLRREVDRLFEDFAGDFLAPFRRGSEMLSFPRLDPTWMKMPVVDFAEKGNAYEITAEVPGFGNDDIEVKLSGSTLTLRGEKKQDKENKDKQYYMRERRLDTFERVFQVPEGADTDKVEASFKDGLLTITLPKKAEALASEKKIAIKAA